MPEITSARRTRTAQVRFNELEYAQIEKGAKAAGLTISEYIRLRLLYQPAK